MSKVHSDDNVRVDRFETFKYSWDMAVQAFQLWKALDSGARFVSLFLVLMTLLALLFGFFAFPQNIEIDTSCISYGSWLLYDLVPLPEEAILQAVPRDRLVLYRILGFSTAAVFAGAVFAVCMRPVRVLRLSKHGAIDLEKDELQFRFWVMMGYKGCLYDVSAELIIARPGDYGMSTARLR